jgi:beta-N-acetylglucosaminidase
VTVTDVNGVTATKSTTINLNPPPPSIVYIDWPSANQNYGENSMVRVAGWVISPNGVSRVTLKVDGSDAPNLSHVIPASSMASLSDIANSMSGYPGGSSNKAYEAYFNTNYLTAGTHTIYVYVTDTNGKITYSGKTITVTKLPSRLAFDNVQASINGAQTITNNMTGEFMLSGYALNPSGVAGVALYLDDKYQGQAELTGSRSDVTSQFPSYPASDDTGFAFVYKPDLSKYSPGNHTLKAVATGIDGSTITLTRTVVKLSPVLYVLPASTMPYTNYNGNSDISVIGFALDDSIVNNVSVSFDGAIIPGILTSISSSDVQAKYPQYPGSSTSKFSATIPKAMLSNGIHIIKVTSRGTDGVTQTELVSITVGGSTYNTSYSITLTSLLSKEQSLAATYGFSVSTSDLDPNTIQGQNNGYEFMSLKYGLGGTGSTLTAAKLETMIPAKAYDSNGNYVNDILSGHAQAFIAAANAYGVNPVYLVAHARIETGNGTSKLANGQVYTGDGKTYYNMYGIGAFDGSANSSGLIAAYQNGWTGIDTSHAVDAAIIGGAQWIAKHYVNSVTLNHGDGKQHYDQDTLYAMKWDPYAISTSQTAFEYATEPDWASSIAGIMYLNRNLLTSTNMTLVFDIPKYN